MSKAIFCFTAVTVFAWIASPTHAQEATAHDISREVDQALANGDIRQAVKAAVVVQDDAKRYDLMTRIAAARGDSPTTTNTPHGGAKGGAALADFDSLIELIQTTVAPESWEEVGGTGTVASSASGVALDARNRKLTTTELKRPSRDQGAPANQINNAIRDQANGLRSVSLPRLETALMARFAAGLPPTEDMLSLGGLMRIDSIAIYPEHNDIVLIGPASDDPELLANYGLRLSDLATALHNAIIGPGKMWCSIDPSQANLARTQAYLAESAKTPLKPGQREQWMKGLRESLGKQNVTFKDVEPDTHLALTLLSADYHMKLIGMGIKPGANVESYLDTVKLNPDGSAPDMAVLRWWFTLQPTAIETNADKNVFRLPNQLLRVQSENEMLADQGVRQNTGQSEPLNRAFAERFTRQFPDLAARYPVYAQLHRVAELTVTAAVVRDEKLCEQIDWKPTFFVSQDPYLVPTVPVPAQVDTVINHRDLNKKTFITGISGGVEISPKPQLEQLSKSESYSLLNRRQTAAPSNSRFDQIGRWWWDSK